MKLHPRTINVGVLKHDLAAQIWRWLEDKDITYVELAQALNDVQAQVLKHMLRHERHPDDPDKKADEA